MLTDHDKILMLKRKSHLKKNKLCALRAEIALASFKMHTPIDTHGTSVNCADHLFVGNRQKLKFYSASVMRLKY